MKQYPIVDFLDKLGLYQEADFIEDQLIREASKQNYYPILLPAIKYVKKNKEEKK